MPKRWKVTVISTSIYKPDEIKNDFKIFPNPSNGIFNIELLSSDFEKLEIFNLTGKLLLYDYIKDKNGLLSYDLSNYKDGIYFIKLSNREIFKIQKIIIKSH